MARAETPPEAADGGFWYVVARTGTGVVGDEYRPDLPEHAHNWTANDVEHGGDVVFLVRASAPLIGVEQMPIRAEALVVALGNEKKPRGRVGGR